MEVKQYIVRVKHDNGIFIIKTSASNIESAKTNICNAENCPESAIITIHEDLKHNVIVSDYIKARLVY